MITLLSKVHSECKSIVIRNNMNYFFTKAFLGKALFFCSFSLLSPASFALKIALFDTGFCPNLLKGNKNIEISQVRDVTQSVSYKCLKGSMKNRRFHGQWVLGELIKHYNIKNKNQKRNKDWAILINNNCLKADWQRTRKREKMKEGKGS